MSVDNDNNNNDDHNKNHNNKHDQNNNNDNIKSVTRQCPTLTLSPTRGYLLFLLSFSLSRCLAVPLSRCLSLSSPTNDRNQVNDVT